MSCAAGDGEAGASAGYEALRSGCAAVGPSPGGRPSWLELAGADRARFLHGLVTCEIKALEAGQGVYGFFVDAKGKILADLVVSALEERLLLELPENKASELRAHMERFIVADQVELKEVERERTLLAGPGAGALLGALGGDPAPGWAGGELELAGQSVLVRGERRLGIDAWAVVTETEAASRSVVEAAEAAGAVAASIEDLEAVRIEEGRPRAGIDFGEDHFPHETGLEEEAVSYTKGCYLGQEVVARIHYRGKVNHALRGLVAEPGDPLPGGSRLEDSEGEDAGRVTSGALSPAYGRWIGLAILHRNFAAPGGRLSRVPSGTVEVVELPFAGRSREE